MTQDELRAMQMCLLDMLVEIDRICKKHDIKYSIDGGTLIGAVRNKGFLPWDDDLDIAVDRSEYEKLREACKTDLDTTRFFFQDNTTDPEYPWGYARIRRIDSEFVRCKQEHLKMRTGIFLDIFPSDGVPDFFPVRLVHAFYCFCCRKTLYSAVGKVHAGNPVHRAVYRALNKIPRETVFSALDKSAKRNNSRGTRKVRCYTWGLPKNKLGYSSKWFKEFTTVEFEGKTFPCFKDYDKYLKFYYDDYMQLPTQEQRRWHPCSAFRLPKEYE